MKTALLCAASGLSLLVFPFCALAQIGDSPIPAGAGIVSTSTIPPVTTISVVEQTLSLVDAIERAHRSSAIPAGNIARDDAARARLRAAKASPNPTLALAQAFGSTATGGFDEGVLATQTIEIGKRGPRTKVAQAALAGVASDSKGRLVALDFEVASAYYEAKRAQTDLDLAQNALEVAQKFDAAAQAQLEAGDAPRQNTVRSSIELSRAQQALKTAQTELQNRFSTLKSLVGVPEQTPLVLSDSLTYSVQNFDEATLLELAFNTRADVQTARFDLESRRASVKSAQSTRLPDAFVEARHAAIFPQSGQPNGNSVRVGVTVPIFDWGSTKASVEEARANEREAQSLLTEIERVATLETRTALATFLDAQQAVQSFDAGRLAKSKELLDMVQIGYEQGASSYLELVDAQTVYRTEQADYARALASWNTALADLKRAVGGSFPAASSNSTPVVPNPIVPTSPTP